MDDAQRQLLLDSPALDPPDGIIPNFANPPNDNGLALVITILCIAVTVVALLARGYSWWVVQLTGRLEAFLVVAGFGSFLGFTSIVIHITKGEVGWWVHQWDVHVGDTIGFSYWVYVAGILYNSAICPVKVAILIEWMRIFSPRSRNAFFWVCQGVIWVNVLYYIAATIVEARQCVPQAKIWDPTVEGGSCLPTRQVELTSSSLNVISDFIILLAPQNIIWRLQMSTKKKLGVALIFAVGLFVCISAIFRLVVTLNYLESDDSTYAVSPVAFWAISEMTSVFLVYCMPAVPSTISGVSKTMSGYYSRWTSYASTRRTRQNSEANTSGAWQQSGSGTGTRYREIHKDSLPLNAINVKGVHSESVTAGHDHPQPPSTGVGVVRTVEIRRNEVPTDSHSPGDTDSGNEVLIQEHPWTRN